MFSVLFIPTLLLADLGAATHSCADSILYETAGEKEGDFWVDAVWEEGSRDECDTEESILFSGVGHTVRSTSDAQDKHSNRASYSMTRGSNGALQSTLRHQAQRDGFSHRLQIQDETLTRRRLGWSGKGWRLMIGDLDDPEMPIWPTGLPRRSLPRGWQKAASQAETENAKTRQHAGFDLASTRPQGFSAGIIQPHWKAWAARAWNPVETGDEPPWSSAWDLSHASTGISLSLPWTFSAQVTDTRIVRGPVDSMSEQLWSASVASPGEAFTLVGAFSKGWALATTWHHRFDNSATMDLTARQRDDAWASSWDPAVTDADAEDGDGRERRWGAGEIRLKGHVPINRARREVKTSVDVETWRAWNPAAGTAREGNRGHLDWSGEGVRFGLTGTRRSARAASGSVSLYRYLEAETRLEENPGFRLAAFRAWNGSGPTRTGIFMGIEPSFQNEGNPLRASAGLRVETDAEDHLSAQGSFGAYWNFARGWNLDAAASAPCYPRWDNEDIRWRLTVNYAVTSSHPRAGGDPDNED